MKKKIYSSLLLFFIFCCFSANGQGTIDFENFESDAAGATTGFSFWNNVTGDNTLADDGYPTHGEWQVETPGAGNSGNTGPRNGSGHSQYLYVEGSNVFGGEVWLISDAINPLSNPLSTVQFDYHMYGASMGSLTLEYSTTGNADEDFKPYWVATGQQHTSETQAYTTATVDFHSAPVTYLRFVGTRGDNYDCDIAIDNITVKWAPAYDYEDFEGYSDAATSGFNFWNNISGDQDNWRVETGTTSSGGTGPTTGTDFLYTETSGTYPDRSGDEFWLVSDAIDPSSDPVSTVYFQYHMFGGHMGTLSLEYSTSGTADSDFTSYWSVSGEQNGSGDQAYHDQFVDFDGIPVTYLRFVGIAGTGYQGDVSLDNIVVNKSGDTMEEIPTLSQWGVIILSLLVLSVCSIAIWKGQYSYDEHYQMALS